MFGKKNAAALEAAAQEVHVVTARTDAVSAVKTVLKVWEGRLAAAAITGPLLKAIAGGSQEHLTKVSLPGDESWAVLRLQVLSEPSPTGTTRLAMSVADYQLFKQMGLVQSAGLAAGLGKIKKATEKLQPADVEIRT